MGEDENYIKRSRDSEQHPQHSVCCSGDEEDKQKKAEIEQEKAEIEQEKARIEQMKTEMAQEKAEMILSEYFTPENLKFASPETLSVEALKPLVDYAYKQQKGESQKKQTQIERWLDNYRDLYTKSVAIVLGSELKEEGDGSELK